MKECNQCGKCCKKYSNDGLSASADEVESWRLFRPDIYKYVNDGQIWFDPDTDKRIEVCPWLRKIPKQNKYTCEIYNDRPEDCRYYPTNIEEMIRDECEMLEQGDLDRPKQAQKMLDEMMADSRPPLAKD